MNHADDMGKRCRGIAVHTGVLADMVVGRLIGQKALRYRYDGEEGDDAIAAGLIN